MIKRVAAWLVLAVCSAWADKGPAINFPAAADLALEWKIDWPPGVKSDFESPVTVSNYNRFSLIISDKALSGIYNELGELTRWGFYTPQGGGSSARLLCFEAQPGHRYFSFWRRDGKPCAPSGNLRSDLPFSELDLLSAIAATPGLMYQPTAWNIVNGSVRQLTSRHNVFLMSVPTFKDFEMTVRIKLGSAQYAGIVIRATDPDRPDATGLYWLINRGSASGSRGANSLWGIVHNQEPGLLLNPDKWNELRAVVTGQTACLYLNGELCKQVQLPPGQGLQGAIGLATYGGTADFDEVRVRDLAKEKLVFEDTFDQQEALSPASWRDRSDLIGAIHGGYFRVQALAGDRSAPFNFTLRFHRDPWSHAGLLQVEPDGFTPWVWVPGVRDLNPMTIILRRATGEPASLEFSSDMTGRKPFYTLPLTTGVVSHGTSAHVCVEVSPADFISKESIRTDAEVSHATLEAVKAMTFKGRAPETFPAGYAMGHRYDCEAGRRLGFNAIVLTDKQIVDDLGFRYIYTYTHLLTASGLGAGYRKALNEKTMHSLADSVRNQGLTDKIYRISVFDEPGDNPAAHIRSPQEQYCMANDPDAWRQMMATANLKPEEFIDPSNPPPDGVTPNQASFWKHVRMRTMADREKDPSGVLKTMQLWAASYPTRFGNARDAIRLAFGTNVLVTANLHDAHFFSGPCSDVDPWLIFSQQEKLDVPQACDYTAAFPPGDELMVDMLRSALQPHDKPVDIYLAAQTSYQTRSPQSLRLRAFGAIGAGARSISFYEYGPRYAATENWYDTDIPRLQTIGDICHAIGWAEDILLAGRPRPASIAILYGRVSDLWDALDLGSSPYVGDRRNIYYLLRNSHLDVDFLCDDVLPAPDQLDRIKVIFMAQRCLAPRAQEALLAWVERGGTLIGILGSGRLNDLAQPQDQMVKAFGLDKLVVEEPGFKSPRASAGSRRIVAMGNPETAGLVATAMVASKSASVLSMFDDGTPAVVQQLRGKGRLICTAFMPGHSYHKDCVFENNLLFQQLKIIILSV
ncbi:MAG: family 16 glycoside hydrolase [bacterium]